MPSLRPSRAPQPSIFSALPMKRSKPNYGPYLSVPCFTCDSVEVLLPVLNSFRLATLLPNTFTSRPSLAPSYHTIQRPGISNPIRETLESSLYHIIMKKNNSKLKLLLLQDEHGALSSVQSAHYGPSYGRVTGQIVPTQGRMIPVSMLPTRAKRRVKMSLIPTLSIAA